MADSEALAACLAALSSDHPHLRQKVRALLEEASEQERRPRPGAAAGPAPAPAAADLAPELGSPRPGAREALAPAAEGPGAGVPAPSPWDACEQRLRAVRDDPRSARLRRNASGKDTRPLRKRLGGLSTEADDQDPATTLVRPSMRVRTCPPSARCAGRLSTDDVLIVPDFLCAEGDLSLYYRLVEEVREAQSSGSKDSRWRAWKDGCHLVSKTDPETVPSYQDVLHRIATYFDMDRSSMYARFNWYVDGADWKPLHHDTAQFSKRRAGKQNITVGVSLGCERELVFRHVESGLRCYFPQANGTAFTFGRAVNVHWKHGINALPSELHAQGGRISIIVWGWAACADDAEDLEAGDDSRPEAFARPCIQFQRGKCTYGERCKFVHEAGPEGRPDGDGQGCSEGDLEGGGVEGGGGAEEECVKKRARPD